MDKKMLRVFVTATDTGVGKTQVASALLRLLREAGESPAPFKPYESGCVDLRHPEDACALKAAAQSEDPLERICPHRFRLPLAPGVAAARERRTPSFERTLRAFHSFDGRAMVAEGAGGLFVPLDARRDVIDLIRALRLPVVLVGRAGLGTLNHVGLSLEALGRRRIPVRAVVLSEGVPKERKKMDPSLEDNSAWLRRRHGVQVLGPVPFVADPKRRAQVFNRFLRPLVQGR